MSLFFVFVLLAVGLTALFLGITVVVQGYLYQEPPPRLPVRALIGGVLLGAFLTLWAWIDKNKPGKYDTFFNFAGYTTVEFNEFEAVRWLIGSDGKFKTDASGKDVEVVVKFKRGPGGKKAPFVEEGTNVQFKADGTDRNNMRFMTGALRVKGPDDPDAVRYNAQLMKYDEDNRRSVHTKAYASERRFVEDKGSRYVNEEPLGTLFVPSTSTIVGALFLNFALLLMWLVVTWPVLRYSFAHALGLTVVGTLVTMLALMPLLFNFNRPKLPPPAPGATARAEASVAPPGPTLNSGQQRCKITA